MRGVDEIIDSKPVYKSGGDGRAGECDCIGLIIGAIRRAGGEWRGTHGSNYAARNEMQSLESSPRLEIGMAMYKYYAPGEAGWNLPAAYKNHPDQNDYYHVGTVLSVSPLKIAHCTSWSGGSGIKIDTLLGAWKYGGRLKGLSYDSEVIPMDKARVDAPSGRTVRMRANPADNATIIANVPIGVDVEVLDKRPGWWQIRHAGKTGWMMDKYLDGTMVPVDDRALLTELEGLTMRSLTIIKALREGDAV